ncbi:Hsp70 family protein [Actinocrispum wychmicini]|uniref:Hsp70 protein n=1 Tax=Actinocrispum wychmicini TaxID=1213861 RepID=A0A4R2J7N5_9PSEU|nr:Hsp70 family protein [Actinocrispum wychmicini]TCO55151.1 Hsp70 protein [Actinocrispum wychmicini]
MAALRIGTAEPRLLGESLPSAVWLDPSGQLVVGRDAERQARLDASRFEPTPKLRVSEGQVLLGDTTVPVVDLLAALLRHVLTEARRELGGDPDQLILTHPAAWGPSRRDALMTATRVAGVRCRTHLVPEPVAAAARFVTLPNVSLAPGQSLTVLDVGGGTTDVAVVLAGPQGWQVLADGGADIGGRDLDFELLQHVRTNDPVWTELGRPTTPAARRVARTLAEDVRAAKEALSRYPHTDIPMPPPLPDAHMTRGEFEALIRPLLAKMVDVLVEVVARARPQHMAGVFLVGGSTRVPLLASLVRERTGMQPVVLESPENTVALGALADVRKPAVSAPVLAAPVSAPMVAAPPPPPPPGPTVVVQPGWAPPPRRKSRLIPVSAAIVAIALVVVTIVLLASNSGPGAEQPLAAAPDDSADLRRQVFGDDQELLRLAVPAVDNATQCASSKGAATDKFNSRTQVRCLMQTPAGYELAIEFMSAAGKSACDGVVSGLGFNAGRSGTWSGNSRKGTWQDVTFAPLDNANESVTGVFYRTDAGTTCAVLNNTVNSKGVTGNAIHQFWVDKVQPR